MKGMSVISGYARYNASAALRNRNFQMNGNDVECSGVINRIGLWVCGNCIAQAWECDVQHLRDIAKKRKAHYVIRDMHGKELERG